MTTVIDKRGKCVGTTTPEWKVVGQHDEGRCLMCRQWVRGRYDSRKWVFRLYSHKPVTA